VNGIAPYQRFIDAQGQQCPIPILLAKQALSKMTAGEVLLIVCTDPVAPRDFARLATRREYELLEVSEGEGSFRILLRR
jgi:tRNA 2-thiouridine synthesizing protein A